MAQIILGLVLGFLVVKFWTDVQPALVNFLEWLTHLVQMG